MKTIRLLLTLAAITLLYVVQAQNSCFGTVYFNWQTWQSNGNDVLFVEPSYQLYAGWNVLSQQWIWDDGTDTTYAGTGNAQHTYQQQSGPMQVCLVTTAELNGNVCTDTFCHFVSLCSTGPTTAEWFSINQLQGLQLTLDGEVISYANPPVFYSMDFGDGYHTPWLNSYSSHFYPSFNHTYAQAGTYVLTFTAQDSLGCSTDSVGVVDMGPPVCNINAQFTTNQGGTANTNSHFVTLTSSSVSNYSINSYSWNIWNGSYQWNSATNTSAVNATLNSPPGFVYNVQLIVGDVMGCRDTVIQQVVLDTCNLSHTATWNLQNFNSTNADTINYSASFTTGHLPVQHALATLYNAVTGTVVGSKTSLNSFFVIPHTNATYRLVLFSNDDIGCADSVVYFISDTSGSCSSINAAFTYSQGGYNNMSPDYLRLTSTSTSANGLMDWYWGEAGGQSYFSGGNHQSSLDARIYPYTPGNSYWITLIVTDSIGCRDTTSQWVYMDSCTMHVGLTTSLANSNGGNQDTLFYTVTTAGSHLPVHNVNIWFQNLTALTNSSSTSTSGYFVFAPGTDYSIKATLNDDIGCMDSVELFGTDSTLPTCNANAAFTYQDLGNGWMQFNNSSTSANGVRSVWTFYGGGGSLGTNTSKNPVFQYTGSQPYYAQLIIIDSVNSSCRDTLQLQITPSAAVNCLTLKPNGAQGMDAMIRDINASTNYGSVSDLNAGYNTINTVPALSRTLLKFDLSGIPAGATITSARLNLYHDPAAAHSTNTSNDIKIAAITAAWNENTVTWANQPTTAVSALNIGNAPTTTSDKLNVDVSSFVQSWVNGSMTNNGWMMTLNTESGALGRFQIYASSDNADSTRWPELVVCYQVPSSNCITLQPDSTAGIDAHIFELTPNTASGSWPDFSASQWTYNSVPGEDRGLIKFDLSAIPAGATVTSATLSLYANINSVGGYLGMPTYGNNNASYLKFVTGSWGENTVTWNNQPTTTTAGQILLPQATSTVMDYTNIDVTSFAQSWVNTPAQNNGMMLDMIGTNFYNSMIFCSSDNPIASKRPKLVVCYSTNPCNIQANFNYITAQGAGTNPDTAILTNLSTGTIGSYESFAHNSSTGVLYSYKSGSTFGAVNRLLIPGDTSMQVCLVVHDTSGVCKDTFCTTIFSGTCTVNPGFTYMTSGSTVTYYNNSTGNLPLLGVNWTFSGGSPATSTADTVVVTYPQYGVYTVCINALSTGGCTNNYCDTIVLAAPPLNDTLCGMVFNDANGNGIFDVNEHVRPNSAVVVDGTTYLTGANGFYQALVSAGNHGIWLNAPVGWSQTYPQNPLNYNIQTAANEHICGIDFGMRDDTLLLSGIVFTDNNANGLYDAGDAPIANAQVHAIGNGNNYVATTNAQGYYSVMVYSGTYTVSYQPLAGMVFTQPINPNTYTITVVTNSVAGLNFGVRSNLVTITGKVYLDANNNGVYDAGEVGITGQPVHVGNSIVNTVNGGNWSITVSAGNYAVVYWPTGNYAGYSSSPTSYTVNATTAGNTYGGNNFGLHLNTGTGDACVTLTAYSNVVAGFPAMYKIYVANNGNIPMAGTLYMYFDPHLTYDHANITPTTVSQANYVLSWHTTLALGQTVMYQPFFYCNQNAVLGAPVFNAISFVPDNGYVDVNMACNDDTLHQVVESSWDPNDKHVSPVGEDVQHLISPDQPLDYTISFQNTGTAPAVNVILLDTIRPELDIATFEMKSASHPCHVQLEGRELTVIFSNIMLPDSGTDFEGSMGFASFTIKPVSGLAEGTQLHNSAGIYFDYNEVVLTNTTLNTIDYKLGLTELANGGFTITLQPNPFKQFTTIAVEGLKGLAELEVLDVSGRLLQQYSSNNAQFTINRDGLVAGLYLFRIKQNGQTVGKGKMIAE
ncbi:MAG: DNRLRE domain-containing protein [Chitinophagales bacterium]